MRQGINDTGERRSKNKDKSNSMLALPSALLSLKAGIRSVKKK